MKITAKLTAGLILGILLVQAGSAAVRVRREQALFREDIAREEKVLGRALVHAVQPAWQRGGEKAIADLIRHATARESHVDIRWVWISGAPASAARLQLSPDQLRRLERGRSVVLERTGKAAAILTYVPARLGPDRLGAVEITDALSDEHNNLWRSIRHAAIAGLLLVTLTAAIAFLVGVVVVGKPMRRLVEQARRVGQGDLTQRFGSYSQDEVGALAREMDRMCDSLARARERIEQETRTRIAAIEQLRHADRLTTVGTMASGLAHELGTPINVVEGHAQLISENPETTSQIKENLVVITRQCKRMTNIIRQLLDFARRGSAWRAHASLGAVAQETLQMLEPLARKGRVMTSLEAPEEILGCISSEHFQQVLTNLVLNGIQAMPEGGALSLRLSSTRCGQPECPTEQGRWAVLEVKDCGIGMDDTTRERIFEPFFTTKEVGEGTGLGLAVVFGLIKENGGWIDVVSAPGQGACFTVYLPAEE